MGAYYKAAVYDEHAAPVILENPFGGVKLMEHAWRDNQYVNSVLLWLRAHPAHLVWLCDYHRDDDYKFLSTFRFDWDYLEHVNLLRYAMPGETVRYIINQSRGEYIDMLGLEGNADGWVIHPLPILTNSDDTSQGGGDYHPVDGRRGKWRYDVITASDDLPVGLTDVTADCQFYE